jgi:uncharacterized protein (DUF4415 family)
MSNSLTGIKGVLGGYVTTPSEPTSHDLPTESAKPLRKPAATSRARLGRPPGKKSSNRRPKEKATLRIDTELMSDYRDWSWDERCQLGELVERALAEYRSRHR